MRLKYRKIMIATLLVIEIILVNLTYQSFLHKEINKEENKVTKKQFAMYIHENGEYVEYKGKNLFPKDYYLNQDLSYCNDNKGERVENVLASDGESVTVTSNKTLYCTLYFNPYKEEDGTYTFYIKENLNPKYTSSQNNSVTLSWTDDDIQEYCLTEDESYDNCNWQKADNNNITTTYTFTNTTNEEKTLYAYLKSKDTIKKKNDKIIYDTEMPVITSVKTIYDLWGGTSYYIPWGYSTYAKDYGLDGTWITSGGDPAISFENVSHITELSGGFVELDSPLDKDIYIQVFWGNSTQNYSYLNIVQKVLKAGETKLVIEGIPDGSWTKIRFDIGTVEGLSYKIKHLGIIASDNQVNNDEIILELNGTVGLSGVDKWQYTYTEGSNWQDINGEQDLTSYMTFSENMNQNVYIRLCSKVGLCSDSIIKEINISK